MTLSEYLKTRALKDHIEKSEISSQLARVYAQLFDLNQELQKQEIDNPNELIRQSIEQIIETRKVILDCFDAW